VSDLTLSNVKLLRDGRLEEGKITVSGARIAAIGSFTGGSGREIDCHGLAALPALVDNHVHFREPGAEAKEDFASGSAASAHGGAATVFEIQNSPPLLTSPELLAAKQALVQQKSCVQVGLYASATNEILPHMPALAEATAGLKLFMAPSHADEGWESDESMRPFFSGCARLGWMLIVHAEDGRLIREASARVDASLPENFSRARPPVAEISAVERAIELAREHGTRLHIFHLSTSGAVDLIAAARRSGVDVTASTCPHYLFFTDDDLAARGSLLKVYPSIKAGHDRKRIIEGLKEGVIEIISTDHAPHTPAEKELPFESSPAGISSADLLLPLLTTLAARGLFSLEEVVALCARNPARIHGLVTGGSLDEGGVADIVLIDLDARWTVSRDDFRSKASLSPYVGMELQGRVAATLAAGRSVYVDQTGVLRGAWA